MEKKKQLAAKAQATINQTKEKYRKQAAEWKEKAANHHKRCVNSNKRARHTKQQCDALKKTAEARLERLKTTEDERDAALAACEELKEEANNCSSGLIYTVEKVMMKTADSNQRRRYSWPLEIVQLICEQLRIKQK